MSARATVLDELAEAAQKRANALRESVGYDELYERASRFEKRNFAASIASGGLSVISEIKRASPSAGDIREVDPAGWADRYESEGAACLSVLTEPDRFKGSLGDLDAARDSVSLPVIRKDFTVDEIQIIEAASRADAVLLIVALLDHTTLTRYISLAHELDLTALVEVHDEREADTALEAGARVVGVNNRDLRDFTVDLGTFERLAPKLESATLVAESGVKTAEDGRRLHDAGADAVLVGESAMRRPEFVAALSNIF